MTGVQTCALPIYTAQVLYRTVDADGHIAYLQNFYSVPWQRIGELLPVRVTERELIVYGPDVKEIARHELYPLGATRQKRTLPAHVPGRDHLQKRELLQQRFAELDLTEFASSMNYCAPGATARTRPHECWAC